MRPALLALCIFPLAVAAQSTCDSVDIISVKFNAFQDTLVEVYARNNNTNEIFGYPGFILKNMAWDTIAMEEVNFFGIGQESVHQLPLSVQNPPLSTFNGTLELWSGFYDSLHCVFQGPFDLCPTDTCVTAYVSIANFGGALTNGTVNWQLLDHAQSTIASGTLSLEDTIQAAHDTVCLSPGSYQLVLDTSSMVGGQPYAGIFTGPWMWIYGVQQFYRSDSGLVLDFGFYERCNVTQGVDNQIITQDNVKVHSDGRTLSIWTDVGPIGRVRVVDALGRPVYSGHTTDSHLTITLPGIQAILFLEALSDRGRSVTPFLAR